MTGVWRQRLKVSVTSNTAVKLKREGRREGEEGKMWHDTKELVNLGEDVFPLFPADLRFPK